MIANSVDAHVVLSGALAKALDDKSSKCKLLVETMKPRASL